MKPRGIENEGQTCFMAAALQALNAMTRVREVLLKTPNNFYVQDSISSQLIKFLRLLNKNDVGPINPIEFCLSMWNSFKFQVKEQQDAAEFLDKLFAHLLVEDITPEIRRHLTYYKDIPTLPKTPLSELVIGMLKSTIYPQVSDERCKPSSKIDYFTVLQLPLNRETLTLATVLKRFFEGESLMGKEQYQCTEKLKVDALRFFSVSELGPYLILGLKRSQVIKNEKGEFEAHKFREPVTFPLSFKFDQNLTSNDVMIRDYNLKAFVVHSGDPSGGHYTAYIKQNNIWYFANDSVVKAINESDIVTIARRGFAGSVPLDYKNKDEISESRQETPVLFFYEDASIEDIYTNEKDVEGISQGSGKTLTLDASEDEPKITIENVKRLYIALGFPASEINDLDEKTLLYLIRLLDYGFIESHFKFSSQ